MYGLLNDEDFDVAKLKASIIQHEGSILYVYDDATGKPIVTGYTVVGTPTVCVGRNATKGRGFTASEADYLLQNDLNESIATAKAQDWWAAVSDNDARSRAMIEMLFQLGLARLNGFPISLGYLKAKDYTNAADGFMDSVWATVQSPLRAKVLTDMLRDGV